MNDYTYKVIYGIVLIAVLMLFVGLLLAFPIMWMWNYAVVYVFKLPVIGWGHAWCLWMLSSFFIKSTLQTIERS